ncbi:MAG: hypothetical protein BHV62_07010 [Eggerthella sp. 51_9]|nr:MAG: hypothetical protein BHV62_07010 [Eggerthella sp. 51_9]
MKRCLLVGAAPSAHKELDYILQTQGFDAVYAVDGGFAALQERGIVPDAVFGDFDSLGAVPQHPCVFEIVMHKLAMPSSRVLRSWLSAMRLRAGSTTP